MRKSPDQRERERLRAIYDKLYAWVGPRHWWPAETPFEVVVGAILTQSVAWRNVVRAIENLKAAGLLDPWALHHAPVGEIERRIVPTRFYKAKAKKLKAFMAHLCERYGGSLERMWERPQEELRRELLGIYGLGPETVDSIMLYRAMQEHFRRHLPAEAPLFNEYHALIDGLGHRLCRATDPRCGECPLSDECQKGRRDG